MSPTCPIHPIHQRNNRKPIFHDHHQVICEKKKKIIRSYSGYIGFEMPYQSQLSLLSTWLLPTTWFQEFQRVTKKIQNNFVAII